MNKAIDKSKYQQIQAVIEHNPLISGFDLYYLGFFSQFIPQLGLSDIFTHISNIVGLYNDNLITKEEKIEFFIRMLSKKIDKDLIKTLTPESFNHENSSSKFLREYFVRIYKILAKYTNVSKFEVFYLGHFHAVCPSYKIAELFHHINNIHALVSENLIDEETKIDFLLTILNKKIFADKSSGNAALHIPRDGFSPLKYLNLPLTDQSFEDSMQSHHQEKNNPPLLPENQENIQSLEQLLPVDEINHAVDVVETSEEEFEEANLHQQPEEEELRFEESQKQVEEEQQAILDDVFENADPQNVAASIIEEEEDCCLSEAPKESFIHEFLKNNNSSANNENPPLVVTKRSFEKQFSFQNSLVNDDPLPVPVFAQNNPEIAVVEESNHTEMEEEEEELQVIDYNRPESEKSFMQHRGEEEHYPEFSTHNEPIRSVEVIEEEQQQPRVEESHVQREEEEPEEFINSQQQQPQSQPQSQSREEEEMISKNVVIPPQSLEVDEYYQSHRQQQEEEHHPITEDEEIVVMEKPSQQQQHHEQEEEELVIMESKEKIISLIENYQKQESNGNGSESESEIKRLMAQLYPGMSKKTHGTFDEILNSLLASSDDARSDVYHKNNKNLNYPQSQGSVNNNITAGQIEEFVFPSSKSQRKDLEHSDEENKEVQDIVENQKEAVYLSQSQQYDQSLMNEGSQAADSYILRWKNTANPNQPLEIHDDELDNVTENQADQILIKREENEARVIVEAETQSNPTLEEGGGIQNTTAKFFLAASRIPEFAFEEERKEQINIPPSFIKPSSSLGQQNVIASSLQPDEIRKESHHQDTQFSLFSAEKLNTLEEERLSKELLQELEKERNPSPPHRRGIEREDTIVDQTLSRLTTAGSKEQTELVNIELDQDDEPAVVANHEEEVNTHIPPSVLENPKQQQQQIKLFKSVENVDLLDLLGQENINPSQLQPQIMQVEPEEQKLTEETQVYDDPSDCSLCMKPLKLKLTGDFEVCGHTFHQNCLENYLVQKINNKEFPLKCPKKYCSNKLRLVDVMDFLPVDMQEKFVSISLKAYVEANDDICCCPTAGCNYAFFKTYRPGRFKCSLCKHVYCMSCHSEWHQGLSCEQYQKTHANQRKEEQHSKFKQCPACQLTTYKTSQSDQLKCQCGTKFCYSCGEIQTSVDCGCHQKKGCAPPIVQPELFHQ